MPDTSLSRSRINHPAGSDHRPARRNYNRSLAGLSYPEEAPLVSRMQHKHHCVMANREPTRWMLLWQDAFLSFTYDRPPSLTTDATVTLPWEHSPNRKGFSFVESTMNVIKILLDRSREDIGHLNSFPRFQHYRRQFEQAMQSAALFLQDKANCKTLREHLERLALHIHVGYALCRVYSLYFESNKVDQSARKSLMSDYSAHATCVVQSFLDMHRLSANACRSSAFVHNVVSSAVTLKALAMKAPESANHPNEEFDQPVLRLVEVLEKEMKKSEWTDADTNVRHFGPYSRALDALKEAFSRD
jgi:hypothetical protein